MATRRPVPSLRRSRRRPAAPSRLSGTPFATRSPEPTSCFLIPLERLQFDEHGDPLHYEVGIFQIQTGRHVLLYPRDRSTGKVILPTP